MANKTVWVLRSLDATASVCMKCLCPCLVWTLVPKGARECWRYPLSVLYCKAPTSRTRDRYVVCNSKQNYSGYPGPPLSEKAINFFYQSPSSSISLTLSSYLTPTNSPGCSLLYLTPGNSNNKTHSIFVAHTHTHTQNTMVQFSHSAVTL